tara:strand:+ start:205 stop:1335 length:1131 start_codon:yes stop_codon:yes gene_type:complete
MKILTVIETVDIETGGGASERARQISLHLHKLGHEVKILTTDINFSDLTRKALESLEVITLRSILKRFRVPFPRPLIIARLVRECDVVNVVNHWSIVTLITYFFCKIYKKPYFISPLGSLVIFGRSKNLKKLYNFIIGKKILNDSAGYILATLEEKNQMDDLNLNISNIYHIPNGVNEDDYVETQNNKVLEKHGLMNNYILFIGRLNEIKGPDILFKAFEKISEKFTNLDLVYIGPDEGLSDDLIKLASSSGLLSRMHILGYVSLEEKASIIRNSLFLTIPSRKEAMSIVVLEAGILGKPVLLTTTCGFDEVEQVQGGLVVEPTINSVSQGLTHLLEKSEDLEQMGNNLKRFVRANYLWSNAAAKHEELFKSYLAK